MLKQRSFKIKNSNKIKLMKTTLYSKLKQSIKKKDGRNNKGSLILRRSGGAHSRNYRPIDFQFKGKRGLILSINYDPNRTAYIATCLNLYIKKYFYQILTDGQRIGDFIGIKGKKQMFTNLGNITPIKEVPVGSLIHSLELKPGKGSQLSRAAGTCIKLLNKEPLLNLAKIKLPSKKISIAYLNSKCILGNVSNPLHNQKILYKAGQSRWLGCRPKVRGVAMNPVDHPHGGGEGKTSGGRPSVTPWGKPTKGQPTAKKKYNKRQS